MKRLAILGSTGSIGQSALRVAENLGDRVQITALASHSNIDLLEAQARRWKPEVLAVHDKQQAKCLQERLPHIPVLGGSEGVEAIATHDNADMVIAAIAGTHGLKPTLSAIEAGKDIALANKETLVSGGQLVTEKVKTKGVKLLPVDSEHSALFQCLQGENPKDLRRVILTASGGPFRKHSKEALHSVTLAEALKHPNWSMGPKITIDSSTLMNKGLEVIEARWLFDIQPEQIEVIVHPQSVIHSMVEYKDSSIIAQMSKPDMVLPIQYAITYPERLPSPLESFDFLEYPSLTFELPDMNRFPCLRLAIWAMTEGGSLPCYMNAANECLVERFLRGEIRWVEIASLLERLMESHTVEKQLTLETLLTIDARARAEANEVTASESVSI